jgi:Leucine-rich repeat (LRR) protein
MFHPFAVSLLCALWFAGPAPAFSQEVLTIAIPRADLTIPSETGALDLKFQPINDETTEAYKKLGADYYVFTANEFGYPLGNHATGAVSKGLPGFRYWGLQKGGIPGCPPVYAPLPTLPQVNVPFGLDLSQSGPDRFGQNQGVKDADLKELTNLNHLTMLNLSWTAVTDTGMKELAKLKQLTILDLFKTKITDSGLKELANLNQLTKLNLKATRVTDAGLKELALLKRLTLLDLNQTPITDAGLKELANLKQLTLLDLNSTQITDAGLKELANLKQLTTLVLDHTQVTDAGLKELANSNNSPNFTSEVSEGQEVNE